jgi:hypothetical protein
VPRTVLLFLKNELDISVATESFTHQIGFVTDDANDPSDSCAADRVKDVFDHRLATDFMQNFRQVGFHPSAFSGGKYDCYSIAHRLDSFPMFGVVARGVSHRRPTSSLLKPRLSILPRSDVLHDVIFEKFLDSRLKLGLAGEQIGSSQLNVRANVVDPFILLILLRASEL